MSHPSGSSGTVRRLRPAPDTQPARPGAAPTVHLALEDRVTLLALESVVRGAGLETTGRDEASWLVTDEVEVAHRARVLVVTRSTPVAAAAAVEAFVAGEVAVVMIPEQAEHLADLISLAERGQRSIPDAVLAAGALAPQLTARQRQVLRLVAEGRSNPVVARHLGVSTRTVKREITNLLDALGCDNRTHLASRARELGCF